MASRVQSSTARFFVRHGAQKTDAMQTNKNLLALERGGGSIPNLSSRYWRTTSNARTEPQIGQIQEEDCSTCKLAEFILSWPANLLTYGFAEEGIGKIKIESITAQLDEAVLNRSTRASRPKQSLPGAS